MRAQGKNKLLRSMGALALVAAALFMCTIALARQRDKNTAKTSDAVSARRETQEPSTSPKVADAAHNRDAENGKRLFTVNGCFECHGTVGQGSTATGPRIGPPPLSLDAVIQYVRRPAGQMPPYTNKVISDSALAAIYGYLKSQPKPPPAKSIPLLNE